MALKHYTIYYHKHSSFFKSWKTSSSSLKIGTDFLGFFSIIHNCRINSFIHKNLAIIHFCVLEANKAIPELSFVLTDSNTVFA